MTPAQLAQILFKRQRVVVLLVFVMVVAATAAITFTLPKEYRATATLFVGENRPVTTGVDAVQLDEVLARTYARLLESTEVREKVVRALPFPSSVSALSGKVDFEVVGGTHLIEVSASDAGPTRARTIANVYAAVFVRSQQQSTLQASSARVQILRRQIAQLATEIERLERNGGAGSTARLEQARAELEAARASYTSTQQNATLQDTNVSVSTKASLPRSQSKPRPKLYMALGILFGLVLATLAALTRNVFDKRIRDEEELTDILEVPVIARIPDERTTRGERRLEDAYQLFRTNLRFQDAEGNLRVLAITSPLPRDGKTSNVYHLAHAIALSGAKVLAIDCDLRRPRLAHYFNVPSRPGLSTALVGGQDPSEVISRERHVSVMAAGPSPPNPATLLTSARMAEVLASVARDEDFVLLDTPPVTVGADASAVAAAADAVVLVVDMRQTRRDALVATRDQLRRANATLLGVVLNRVRDESTGYGYYGPEPDKVVLAGGTKKMPEPEANGTEMPQPDANGSPRAKDRAVPS